MNHLAKHKTWGVWDLRFFQRADLLIDAPKCRDAEKPRRE
jgi:hypothetical protein